MSEWQSSVFVCRLLWLAQVVLKLGTEERFGSQILRHLVIVDPVDAFLVDYRHAVLHRESIVQSCDDMPP